MATGGDTTEAQHVEGMPITGVTLYDNGYAVFQRETLVQGHGSIDLYFSSAHMSSVLDSLQLMGEAGKKVGNIAYEATKPTASVELNDRDPLVALLRSLVGRLLALQHHTDRGLETVEGRILGVDEHLHDTELKGTSKHVTVLVDGGVVRSLPLHAVHSFQIAEGDAQQDVVFSLGLLRNRSREDMQRLSVFYSDVDKPQKLVARYGFRVTEWKSSYRMTLSEHATNFNLVGLAIVENSLGEDWNDIALTLVVGAPPIETGKPVDDQGIWELKIKGLDGHYFSVRANPKDAVLRLKGKIARKKNLNLFGFRLVFAGKTVEEGRVLSDYTMSNNSTLHMTKVEGHSSQRAGSGSTQVQFVMASQDNLSYYPIPMTVTAKRKQKAIVPLLQVELEGQKVFLYDESIRKGNPLSAVLFENTTGRTLEGGMLQISSTEVFLGQATLPTLHPGDESPPIPFAVELGCEVTRDVDTTNLKPHRLVITEGLASVYHVHREYTFYRIKNKSDRELDFLLNHLFLEGYDLVQNADVEEEEPVDITDRFYQFRFVVPARIEKKTFVVREEITDKADYPMESFDEELLEKWLRMKLIDGETERAIRDLASLRRRISAIQKDILEKSNEVSEVQDTQAHIRKNISALERHEKEAAKYIKSLATEEDKLKALQEGLRRDRQTKKELKAALSEKANAIEFSRDSKEPKAAP